MDCITFTENGEEAGAAHPAQRAGAQSRAGPLYRQFAEDRAHHGQGRGCLPALRPVRRALSDRRMGHEQIPSTSHRPGPHAAADNAPRALTDDIQSNLDTAYSVNDFVVKFANVNGSGSASANALFAKSVLRMGIPASSRNIFPSNIQGLPTWFEVRISERRPSRPARRRRHDGRDEPADLEPGHRRDRARRLSALQFDKADAGLAVPRRHQRDRRAADRDLQPHLRRCAAAAAVQEHHLSRRAVGAARHGRAGDREADRRAVPRQGRADQAEPARAASRARLGDRANSIARSGCGSKTATRSATASSSAATTRRRWARSMAARRCAPGTRSPRPPRSPRRSRRIATGCAATRRPRKSASRSSRPRTSWPRSAW